MAFSRTKEGEPSDPLKFLKIGAHFCILKDGRIIQLHPISRMIWHAQCLSHKSIGVEFEGNFPNIDGKWWKPKEAKYFQEDIPTNEQYESGKFLTQYLKYILGITNINAHRQSSKNRTNDPGPHIWKNIGEWAIHYLSLSDGGNVGKCGDGSTIDPRWRTYGESNSLIKEEFQFNLLDENEDEFLKMKKNLI
ncbi:MAG: N-acetylmuramoyl-L-alanine amidase [Saprospiraceae bacterium]|nr:N-acetylmuramoyl-L-alanine amidase [Saprospiraceae bacterium]